jgi:outer membrane lipoprotein-sorting protein
MNDLPPTLDRFGTELEDALRRDLGSRRRHRRVIRGAVVLAAVAAAALGLLSVFGSGGPTVVERAAAALQPSDDSILHYQIDAEQQNADGTTVSWHSETWQLRVPPFTRRQIEIDGSGGIRAESVSKGDTSELYDARTDTIYSATSKQLRAARMPRIEIVSKSKLEKLVGSSHVHAAYAIGDGAGAVMVGAGAVTVIATEQGAERLRLQIARERAQESTGVLPAEFRSEILALLESGRVRVVGHLEVGGRDAIKLESLDGKRVYVVDASTYDPIEWTTTGNSGGVALRFPVYEELPVDPDSLKLLSLQDQHPNARVVRGAMAYIAAESRLYPHG